MSLSASNESLPSSCSIFGSSSGTAESAFTCAAGADSAFVSGLWMTLAAVLFLALWLRLIWKAWGNVVNSSYKWDQFAAVIIRPLLLFAFVFTLLSNI